MGVFVMVILNIHQQINNHISAHIKDFPTSVGLINAADAQADLGLRSPHEYEDTFLQFATQLFHKTLQLF